MIVWITHLSGTPNPASPPVSGWIQPIVISPPDAAPVVEEEDDDDGEVAEDEEDDEAPWMPELHASSRAPPPTTAAPTPAARSRLRREAPRAAGAASVLSGWAVWSVMVWISP
jgi:hypothetical protein